MNDTLFMSSFQCVSDLASNEQRFVKGNLAERNTLRERWTLNQFHYQVIWANVKQSADVWVVERGNRMCLAFEPFAELFRADFDCDIAAQTCVMRFPYRAHASSPKRDLEFVWTESPSGCRAVHGKSFYRFRLWLAIQDSDDDLTEKTANEVPRCDLVPCRAPLVL